MWSESLTERVTTAVDALGLTALRYPELLLRELPGHDDPALTGKIEEVARLAVGMNMIDTINLREKIFTVVKGLPRIPARAVFDAALAAARKDRKTADDAKASAEGAAPSAVRRDLTKTKNHVVMRDGVTIKEGIVGEERIANFALALTARVLQDDGPALWRVRVDVPEQAVFATEGHTFRTLVAEWLVPAGAWNGKKPFIAARPHEEMAWMGSDDDVQATLECLLRNVDLETLPTIRSTTVLGRHRMPDGTERWLGSHYLIGPGRHLATPTDLCYTPEGGGGSHLATAMPSKSHPHFPTVVDSDELRALAKIVLPNLLALNDPVQCTKFVGWAFATLWAPFLRTQLSGCPSTNVTGTTGSGKTTFMMSVWRVVTGATHDKPLSLRGTVHAMNVNMASCNAGFLLWDEIKDQDATQGPNGRDLKREWMNSSRCGYTGEKIYKGKVGGGLRSWGTDAPHGIGGEDQLEGDEALHSRMIFFPFSRYYVRDHVECQAAYAAIRHLPIDRLGPYLHAFSLGDDGSARLAEARTVVAGELANLGRDPKALDPRLVDNMTWVVFGLLAFEAACAEVGAVVPSSIQLRDILHSMIADAWSVSTDEAANPKTSARPRTSFDLHAVEYSQAASLGILTEGKEYRVIDKLPHICLPLAELTLQTWRRQRGTTAALGLTALRAQAKEMQQIGTSYVVHHQKDVDFGEQRHRCVVFDPSRYPPGLDMQPFPTSGTSTWGGARSRPTAEELLAEFGKKGGGDRGPN
jgi:hypothetical protein